MMKTYKVDYDQYNKIIMIADIHLGCRAASEEWQENIKNYFYEWFIPFLKTNSEHSILCVLGDVYDNRKSINIAVNNLAIDIFEDLSKILPVYIISGNHDLYKKTFDSQTSLRSLDNIKHVNVITEPSLMKFIRKDETAIDVLALPYLGNKEEGSWLEKYSDLDFAFMHSEIMNLKMDNGQNICTGANPKKFKGKIYSGHIHWRQQKGNAMYDGSQYQLRSYDIGNEKRIYIHDLESKSHKFYKNTYSPKFQKINIDELMDMDERSQKVLLENNYNDILIPEEYIKQKKYKISNVYDLAEKFKCKRFEIVPLKNSNSWNITDSSINDVKELNLESLINLNIENLPDIPDNKKRELKKLSVDYYKAAEHELENSNI